MRFTERQIRLLAPVLALVTAGLLVVLTLVRPGGGWFLLIGVLVGSSFTWLMLADDRRPQTLQSQAAAGLAPDPESVGAAEAPRLGIVTQYCMWTAIFCLLYVIWSLATGS